MTGSTSQFVSGTKREIEFVPGATGLMVIIRITLACLLVSLVVEGILPQAEMAIFGGRVLIPLWAPTLFVIGMALMLLILRPSLARNKLILPTVVLAAALAVCGINLVLVQGLTSIEVFHTYGAYYFLILIITVYAGLNISIPEGLYTFLLYFAFLANVIIAGAQFATGAAILPVASNDGAFVVHSSVYTGVGQRAFGFFNSGLDLGMFAAFMGGFGIVYCKRAGTFIFGILVVLAAGFVCYATYTRLVFVEYLCCLVSVLLLSRRSWSRATIYLPLVWLMVGIGLAIQALTSNRTFNNIASTDSMNTRLLGWLFCVEQFVSSDFVQRTLGLGMVPKISGRGSVLPTKIALFPIDNIALIVLIYLGVVGLIAVSYYLFMSWRLLHRAAIERESKLTLAIAGFFSTVLLTSIYNFTLVILTTLLLIAVTVEDVAAQPPELDTLPG